MGMPATPLQQGVPLRSTVQECSRKISSSQLLSLERSQFIILSAAEGWGQALAVGSRTLTASLFAERPQSVIWEIDGKKAILLCASYSSQERCKKSSENSCSQLARHQVWMILAKTNDAFASQRKLH